MAKNRLIIEVKCPCCGDKIMKSFMDTESRCFACIQDDYNKEFRDYIERERIREREEEAAELMEGSDYDDRDQT